MSSQIYHSDEKPTTSNVSILYSVKGQQRLNALVVYVCVCVCYLGWQQSVRVEALHADDQVVIGVDDIFDEHAVEKEPVGPTVHRDAFWDFAVTQPPHVCVTLKEQTV